MTGKLLPPGFTCLYTHVRSVSCGPDVCLDLCTAINGSPLVRCPVTGQQFGISWTEIIALATEAGILKPATEGRPR